MNPIDYFDGGCRIAPQGDCLVNGETGQRWTYSEIAGITRRVAASLRRTLSVGGRAAILGPNDAMGFAITLGCYRAGIVTVPLNPRGGLSENIQIARNRNARILFLHGSMAEQLPDYRAAVPSLLEIVVFSADEAVDASVLEAWWGDETDGEIDLPDDPERIYCVQSTGGTTGAPKGVLWTNREFEFTVASFLALAPAGVGRPVMLATAPLTHAAGKVVHHLFLSGVVVVILAAASPRDILVAIERHRVTHLFLPPTVIYRLLDDPAVKLHDYSSLLHIVYGAAPISPDRLRQCFRVFGPVMTQAYGQTEAGVPICCMRPTDHFVDGVLAESRLGAVGRAGPLTRVEIMDGEGRIVPPGEVGEIVVRSAGIMAGYDGDVEATAATRAGPWHRTGDIGHQDDAGFFHIVDRKKDMIITGGFNVYSAEVERVLSSHPVVAECAVIGVPHDDWGEAVKAVVELKPGEAAAADELIAFCKAELGSLKAPKSIDFIDVLPRSAAGKVLKRVLREPFWAMKERAI